MDDILARTSSLGYGRRPILGHWMAPAVCTKNTVMKDRRDQSPTSKPPPPPHAQEHCQGGATDAAAAPHQGGWKGEGKEREGGGSALPARRADETATR